jgi:hypothetical protein
MTALRLRQQAKDALTRRMTLLDAHAALGAMNPRAVREELQEQLNEWRGLLRRHVPQARQILKKLFPAAAHAWPQMATATRSGAPRALRRLCGDFRMQNTVASPAGFGQILRPEFRLLLPAA